jgi:transcriptional regulator with XRE-family HTH domain
MRIDYSKNWCMRMAELEADAEIGAGALAADPVFESKPQIAREGSLEETVVAFGRFIHLMRRSRGWTVERLAEDADVDLGELVSIEDNRHRPDVRTVYQLARRFGVPQNRLMQVAGLTMAKDPRIATEAVRFAARSEGTATLTPDERSALEAFVAVLSERE